MSNFRDDAEPNYITALRSRVDLVGWRQQGSVFELSRSVPYGQYEDTDVITIEIQELKNWAWSKDIDREEYRDVTFAELRNGKEAATYFVRFTLVRDPDLNDLDHLRMFLTNRLGDPSRDNWNEALKRLNDEADRDFSARMDAFEKSTNKPAPSTSREDRAARAAEFKAWREKQERAILAAHRASHERLTIAGSAAGYILGGMVEVFTIDKFDQDLFDQIPDEHVRQDIDNYIQRKLNVAYRLGRWIREAEIVEDHGPMVERGKKANVDRAGRQKGADATAAFKRMWQPVGFGFAAAIRVSDPAITNKNLAILVRAALVDYKATFEAEESEKLRQSRSVKPPKIFPIIPSEEIIQKEIGEWERIGWEYDVGKFHHLTESTSPLRRPGRRASEN